MSYEEFRRRIDTARQILVGAVPSPAGQIDQITYALMYKFMNDIDDESAALGGKRSYFVGEYAKFNWHELMSTQLGAHERLELYREAIQTMAKNENLPELFRSIYQNAFLPFNSANVLTLFLKEIDKFSHGESDDIGDAYEYLLSITGAQGDVGQFRTPRHIIKFIVEAVNPTKDDKVLDPAVGTAGFLIAAYNHVRSQHDGKTDSSERNDEKRLTADELHKIHHNYRGFDIDPTMVRTAKINMYLHGFKTPDIINHDSLSSEEYWNDWYDVILANPPFMTPKGGIQPHKKFGISANRAEVLFVDYIASHLKPTGRAGIVVPEGIIFQSGKAYKELRKNLVENSLYAVVSLPAGVFNPYAGVKTSVLLLDKELAKQRDEILFVKVENDGYSLNAQRRPIAGSQFPEALEFIEKFKAGEEFASEFTHTVPRSKIAESGDYNLSGDRYRVTKIPENLDWPVVELGEVIKLNFGERITKKESQGTKYPVYGGGGESFRTDEFNRDSEYVIARFAMSENCVRYVDGKFWMMDSGGTFSVKPDYIHKVDKGYVGKILLNQQNEVYACARGGAQKNLNNEHFYQIKIPLPPIEIQREIVAELDGYQKIIDAAQTIVQTYKPTIKINPDWGKSRLGDLLSEKPMYGSGASKTDFDHKNRYIRITDITGEGELKEDDKVSPSTVETKYFLEANDLLIARSGSVGRTYLHRANGLNYQWAGYLINFRIDSEVALPEYVYYVTKSPMWWNWVEKHSKTGTLTNINAQEYSSFEVPLPPIETQREIVAELEAEQQLINANKKLIEIYQQKIKSKIAEVWGE